MGIVLLLCCVNVGGLMMSKVYARRQAFAIRTAIGAARWRLMRQYLTESFVIALTGGVLGAAAAWYGTGHLLSFFRHPNEGKGMFIEPDRAVFLVTGFFALVTTLLFGTLPAWRAGGADPGNLLKSRTFPLSWTPCGEEERCSSSTRRQSDSGAAGRLMGP